MVINSADKVSYSKDLPCIAVPSNSAIDFRKCRDYAAIMATASKKELIAVPFLPENRYLLFPTPLDLRFN